MQPFLMDSFSKQIGNRLREAAETKQISIAQVAEALRVSPGSVSHYYNGRNELKYEKLLNFCNLVNVPVQNILTPASETSDSSAVVDFEAGDLVKLPVRDGTIEGGSGAGPTPNEIIGQMVFSKSWLDAHGMAPSECSLILIQDKHMSPTLIPGDVVLIDHRKTNPVGKEVFALRSDDGQLWVRRLEVEPDKLGLFVHCDNSKFRTLLIPPDKREANPIIGKVVWSSRKWP